MLFNMVKVWFQSFSRFLLRLFWLVFVKAILYYLKLVCIGEGSLWLWGCNESGQIGKGDLENSCTPFTLSSTPDFK